MIPLIDISNTPDCVHEIERASHDIGFMTITGHGISPQTIANARAAVVEYFNLPKDKKTRDQITRDNYRGYIPLGFFSANSGGGVSDLYEGYKLHYEVSEDDPICMTCDLYGPNKPEHFKRNMLAYWRECDRVATLLLGAFADILDVDKKTFLQLFDGPLTNMTLLHYPPQSAESDGFGIHPHKDTDALTILAGDPVGGLMVRCRGEQDWIEADPPGDALIVNIGDLLELWSGGYFVSTPHKVVNSSGAERYSFPYFAVPRFDTIVEPLNDPQPGFHRSEIHVGDASRDVWRSNWPGERPNKTVLEVSTVES